MLKVLCSGAGHAQAALVLFQQGEEFAEDLRHVAAIDLVDQDEKAPIRMELRRLAHALEHAVLDDDHEAAALGLREHALHGHEVEQAQVGAAALDGIAVLVVHLGDHRRCGHGLRLEQKH